MTFATIVGSLLFGLHLAFAGLLHLGSLDPSAPPATHCCVCPWNKPGMVSGTLTTTATVGALPAAPVSPSRLRMRAVPLVCAVAPALRSADARPRTSRGPPARNCFFAQERAGAGV